MSKIYHPALVQERIDEVQGNSDENEENTNDVSYGKVCCSGQYKNATYVGCTLAVLQQLTGINFIMFYSNTLFAGGDISA